MRSEPHQLLNPGQQRWTEPVYWWLNNNSVYWEPSFKKAGQQMNSVYQYNHTKPLAIALWSSTFMCVVEERAWPRTVFPSLTWTRLERRLLTEMHRKNVDTHTTLTHSHTVLLLTSAQELQVADLFSDLQTEGLVGGPPASASPARSPSSQASRRSNAAKPVLARGGVEWLGIHSSREVALSARH